ncbi:hypothetical protein IKQ19_08010 [Candidatus Saccharibacteria bacterium]|nr:hypothetical protein [Candidatus Saccharibacteria bacterium]
MRMLFFAIGILFFFGACSSSDGEKNIVQSNENNERINADFQQSKAPCDSQYIAQLNGKSTCEVQSNKHIVVELLSVDSCFAHYEYNDLATMVDSLLAKQRNDAFYTIRVLGVTQCPPAEKPDYLEYSYEDDTLVLSIDKKDRSFDVTSSCMYWAEILIKGDISFNKILINGNTFPVSVKKNLGLNL